MDGKENREVAVLRVPDCAIMREFTQIRSLRRSQPASSAAGQQRRAQEENPQAQLARSARSGALLQSSVSPAHQTSGPSTRKTTSVAASATARIRLRPAFCSCITPSEAITTRRVR